ncbi:pheophytinase, chloroplastic [Diospyros lotus]|uniref:pheophytinase, chloroplastic n=1 Tax=Diospyros lotus TaxID=55363 RepID=UPI0022582C54|nr:pheophytinase, chloroplastic [Diospyros lotus]XP_052186443.1 pheophytinase, chloroplastic [Diospyros lotus]XP_052186444.1 pheophytinase, chloroplastic [Diospyros lotus]
MYMASSSSSSFTFTKVDLPVRYLQRIRKNLLPPSLSRKSLLSYRTPTVSLPHVYRPATTTVSRLDDHVINDPTKQNTPQLEVCSSTWNWRGFSIRYQHSGNSGPALVLVHGFGANSDHWRKNIPVLARSHRVFSIDLIGYGYSDKPNPREYEEPFYTFETWAMQLNEFCIDVVKDKAYFVCNSIGGVVGLQAAVMEPETCMGIMLLNISLRMLHTNKQPWYGRPLIRLFQNLLRNTALGNLFYKSVARPDSIRSILSQCYHDTSQVTDELVQAILLPGLQPGAADVFLEFICYSGGPLPEELLPLVKCPVLIAWGDKDPWEPIELGRTFGKFDSVEDFIVLPNVGHCPHDEAPHLVNQLIESFVARHAKTKASLSPKII